jgi:parvulin-like peptidyl-prolyl isomerase
VLRHRLLHFVVAGGLIFALAPRPVSQYDVVLDGATLAALERAQAQRLGAPLLDADEADRVRTRAIEDEILYREAIRLGFDKDDTIVRQRLIQKVLFLAEDLAGASTPATEDELRAFFAATRAQWTRPARIRLLHVYGAPAREAALAALRSEVVAAEAAEPGVPPSLGDAFPLSRVVAASRDEVAADYGDAFAGAVFALAPGTWSGPIRSKHGWHLVKVLEQQEGGPATFEDVRGKLPLLYLVARKKEATTRFLREAAGRYRITVDGRRLGVLRPSERTAPPRVQEPD